MNVLALLSDSLLSTLRSVLRNDHRVVVPPGRDLLAAVRSTAVDVLVLEPSAVAPADWQTLTDFLAHAGTPTVQQLMYRCTAADYCQFKPYGSMEIFNESRKLAGSSTNCTNFLSFE